MTNKDMAEAYALALAHGWIAPEPVVQWLDALIESSPSPHQDLIDASLAASHLDRLIHSLHSFPGSADYAIVRRLLFGHMLTALLKAPSRALQIANALIDMASVEHLLDTAAAEFAILIAEDAEHAARGDYYSLDELRQDLESFLREHAISA